MTLAEFLEWEATQNERHEFYRGEIFAMVGGTARHNRVILNLASRIDEHLHGSPCQVFAESMKVQLADDGSLYPDVMVTCASSEAGDELVVTDPKLIIEALSPTTRGDDKRDRFILYRTLPSLLAYVLIEPEKRQVEVFTLTSDGAWLLKDQTHLSALTLAAIDLVIPFEQVFRGVAPEAT